MKTYDEYKRIYARDLGIDCDIEQDWGGSEGVPGRVAEFVEYYHAHPEYDALGREMLLWLIANSVERAIQEGTLTPAASAAAARVFRDEISMFHVQQVVHFYLVAWGGDAREPNVLRTWFEVNGVALIPDDEQRHLSDSPRR